MQHAARFDPAIGALTIEHLDVTDPDVIREAARWTTGSRGEPAEITPDTDLTPFIRATVAVGARVFEATAQSSDTLAVQHAVKSASLQIEEATIRVARASNETLHRAVETISQSTRQTQTALLAEINRLVGGEDPELAVRLRPILSRVGTDLQAQVADAMAKASDAARAESEKRHGELADLIREVQRDMAVRLAEATAARDAAATVTKQTTLKGSGFETQLNEVMSSIAAGLGDEYQATGDLAGRLARNKKGDGVLHIAGGSRLVIEAHDGTSKAWAAYLEEAERNRGAVASVGVMRSIEDNHGHLVRVISPRRILVAFDPETDDPQLFRTCIQLMRTVCLTAGTTSVTADVSSANEHIREALAVLAGLDETQKAVSAIRGHADKIEKSTMKVLAGVQRELASATTALSTQA